MLATNQKSVPDDGVFPLSGTLVGDCKLATVACASFLSHDLDYEPGHSVEWEGKEVTIFNFVPYLGSTVNETFLLYKIFRILLVSSVIQLTSVVFLCICDCSKIYTDTAWLLITMPLALIYISD